MTKIRQADNLSADIPSTYVSSLAVSTKVLFTNLIQWYITERLSFWQLTTTTLYIKRIYCIRPCTKVETCIHLTNFFLNRIHSYFCIRPLHFFYGSSLCPKSVFSTKKTRENWWKNDVSKRKRNIKNGQNDRFVSLALGRRNFHKSKNS